MPPAGWSNPEAAADLSDDEGDDDEHDAERFCHLWADLPDEPTAPPDAAREVSAAFLSEFGRYVIAGPGSLDALDALCDCLHAQPGDPLRTLRDKCAAAAASGKGPPEDPDPPPPGSAGTAGAADGGRAAAAAATS